MVINETNYQPQKLTPALLTGLALLSASGPFATDMYLAALPRVVDDLSTTATMVQLTLSGFMVGMAIGQLVIGGLSDSLGRRGLMIGGAVLALAASIVCAMTPSIGILIAARLVQGLGSGACVVLARTVIPDLAKGVAAAKAFTLMMIIQGIAPVLAPVLGALLVEPIGWRGIFWVLSGICALQLLVAVFQVKESHPKHLREGASFSNTLRGYPFVLKNRGFVGYGIAFSFIFAVMFSYISASPFVIQQQLGFSPTMYSVIFAVNALGMMAMGAVNNRLMDRHTPEQIIKVAIVVIGVAVVLLALAAQFALTPWLVLPAFFLVVAPMPMVMGNATALATGLVRERAGAGSAVLGFTQFLLAGIVSPLVGIDANHAVSMSVCMIVAFVIAAVGLVVAVKSTR